MFWPQVVRGLAIMFCLLPPTRLALGHLDAGARARRQRPLQPDAQSRRRHRPRADRHGDLHAARRATASHRRAAPGGRRRDGPVRRHAARPVREPPAGAGGRRHHRALVRPLVEKAALVQAINDAWALVAALTVAALLCVPFAKELNEVGMTGQAAWPNQPGAVACRQRRLRAAVQQFDMRTAVQRSTTVAA